MTIRLFAAALLMLALAADAAHAAGNPKVVVSVRPLHSLVAGLMKGVGEPRLLVDGERTPYEVGLEAEGRNLVAEADLVIWAGPALEGFMAGPVSQRAEAGKPVLTVLADDQMKILPARYAEAAPDPYFWLDIRNAEVLVDVLAEALAEADPDNARAYLENRAALKEMTAQLDRRFEYGYRAVAAGPVYLYHDTQQYFAQAYALDEAGFVAPRPTAEPGGGAVLKAVQGMRDAGVHCLLVDKGLPQTNLDLLAEGAGVRVVTLDPFGLGFEPGPDLYPAMMQANFQAIAGCVDRRQGN